MCRRNMTTHKYKEKQMPPIYCAQVDFILDPLCILAMRFNVLAVAETNLTRVCPLTKNTAYENPGCPR